MNLADYQQKLSDQIYKLLVFDDNNVNINLHASSGTGKTTIAKSIIDLLKDTWKVFYIEGIDTNLSPYLTWHAGTKLHSTSKWKFDNKLSFGVSYFPASCSLEFGLPHIETNNYILSANEVAILQDIKNQSCSYDNILLVVDNYELWDIPSKQFLQKLLMPQLNLITDIRVNILIISNTQCSILGTSACEYFTIDEIHSNDILFVLHQNGFNGLIDIDSIKAFAGKDLTLALMAGKYYDRNKKGFNNVDTLIEHKLAHLCEQEQEACEILEPLSIIDAFFSHDEAAFFLSLTLDFDIEVVYKAEEYLYIAETQNFITGDEIYKFTNEMIKGFFNAKLSRKAKYLHKQFAEYLKYRHPDDYGNRAKHLNQSIRPNDIILICETWQIYFLSYARICAVLGWDNDIYEIIPQINALINKLDLFHMEAQKQIFENCLYGFVAFSKYDYRTALNHLCGLGPMQLCIALRAEVMRIVTLCHIQLAESKNQIHQAATELYDLIESSEFNEDEQYCRAALVLLDAFLDKSNHLDKVYILKRKITSCINKHLHIHSFMEFYACFNRKSALYYSATIATRQTEESVLFYRNSNNQTGLYMSLCNYAANALVCGKYESANLALLECEQLVKTHKKWYFPSQYKVDNNKVLLTYLISEQNQFKDDDNYMVNTKYKFEKLLGRNEDEVSHVIYLNYLSVLALCDYSKFSSELKYANKRLTDVDEFYQFYLHDLNFADEIINGNIKQAEKELDILRNIDAPLLHPYDPIFRTRMLAQYSLLQNSNKVYKNPKAYDNIIKKSCTHIQDSCGRFFGRGFLLSDLQFLSF